MKNKYVEILSAIKIALNEYLEENNMTSIFRT
ncbi:hypothetical protein Cycma_3580 [Cyclobacterium marinum DSM 745]|uniref:Uncharacterized protein n=1 Tax=Cyclobacterium marinum (strain ATCC 25205 / DSM 745 / LMG 13164 / NCIMB 1802) TaxID=880070 RepID=G0J039_CYCMS|nr:hypothetical protein Cycma_3580 [Cyclobacterium marinum DSM 745]